jgi:hypothetical protein
MPTATVSAESPGGLGGCSHMASPCFSIDFCVGAENCLMNSIRQPSAWWLSLHANDPVPARCISTGQNAINTLKYIEAAKT